MCLLFLRCEGNVGRVYQGSHKGNFNSQYSPGKGGVVGWGGAANKFKGKGVWVLGEEEREVEFGTFSLFWAGGCPIGQAPAAVQGIDVRSAQRPREAAARAPPQVDGSQEGTELQADGG